MARADRTSHRASSGTRILRWLTIALLVVALLWTAAWFFAADAIEREFDERTKAMARAAQADIACGRRKVSGFPFALAFTCDEDVMVETDRADIALTSVSLRTGITSLSTVRASFVGPANLAFAPGITVRSKWSLADAVVSDAFNRRRIDTRLRELNLDLPGWTVTADDLALRLSPEGQDLDIRLRGQELTLQRAGRPGSVFASVFGDVTLQGLHQRLIQNGQPFSPRNGLVGTITRLGFDGEGDGRVLVSGPFEVSPEGLVSGTFTIAVRDAESLESLASDLTGGDERIAGALTAFAMLGEEREIDGARMRSVELQAVRGQVPFGFFTFDLPRLWRVPPN